MATLAVVATMPGREDALRDCLFSLRDQVDELRVICHDMKEPPDVVVAICDKYVCEPDRLGSAAKMRWAREWAGLYLGCDDDIQYPPDYVDVMRRWVKRWKGQALVTCHGRVLRSEPDKPNRGFKDQTYAAYAFAQTDQAWLNYPGGCAIAFDTRLNVPTEYSSKSCEEAGLAVWAQLNQVPIFLVPHPENWLHYLLPSGHKETIWEEEKSSGFARRNAELAKHTGPWTVYTRK